MVDIADGICSVLGAPNPSHFAYNISTGKWISLGDIIDALMELRPDIKVIDASSGDPNDASYGGSRSRMDVSRPRDDIGFTAEYDLYSMAFSRLFHPESRSTGNASWPLRLAVT